LAAQYPQWADLPINRFPSAGTVNALYRLGTDMVVRLPLIAWGVGDVEREDRWLQRIAPLLPVATPVLLATGVPDAGYPCPWSVYRWLAGENPEPGRVADPGTLARDLAAFIAALHRISPDGEPMAFHSGPVSDRDKAVHECIAQLRGIVDTDAVTAAWESDRDSPEWTEPPRLVHADLIPGNLLLTGGRLSAIIDWSAAAGDPACDLITAWYLFPPDVRQEFRTLLAADDAMWARGRAYALSKAIIALPYYQESNPVMAANSRHVIDQVLIDHSGR
jgi:aminoglycoside phosphotransferase (APT) family kinase protein